MHHHPTISNPSTPFKTLLLGQIRLRGAARHGRRRPVTQGITVGRSAPPAAYIPQQGKATEAGESDPGWRRGRGRGTHLLLDEGALVVEALEDEVGDLLDDAGVGGAQELADLLELVDGRDFVVVRRDAVHHPRAPVRLHRPPALIHGCCPDRIGGRDLGWGAGGGGGGGRWTRSARRRGEAWSKGWG